jgi:hypothetical protein
MRLESLASQSMSSWNQIVSWLKEMETLDKLPPNV